MNLLVSVQLWYSDCEMIAAFSESASYTDTAFSPPQSAESLPRLPVQR
jgi:hypothetical protein